MDAVDLHPLTAGLAEVALGTDVDTWFMALDSRVVRVGNDTCLLRVEGIHSRGSTLWIQVALFDDSTPGVVLQVRAEHSQQDVVDALRDYELSGVPLEIITIGGRSGS